MKFPDNTVISVAVLYDELLSADAPGNRLDFLRAANYTPEQWSDLETDLRRLLTEGEAIRVKADMRGDYYEIDGYLRHLHVKTLWYWSHQNEAPHFVTLFPNN